MKTVKPKTPGKSNPSMLANTFRLEREQLQGRTETEIEKIQVIRSYSTGMLEYAGIGYRDGTLVEFNASESGFKINKITLLESVEWLGKMHFAECRVEMCVDFGDSGWMQFLGELAAALKASGTAAKN